MFTRLAVTSLAVLLLAACEEPKEQSKQEEKSICKGLSETDCVAKTECEWIAEKAKCNKKKGEDTTPSPQTPAPETTPPQ